MTIIEKHILTALALATIAVICNILIVVSGNAEQYYGLLGKLIS